MIYDKDLTPLTSQEETPEEGTPETPAEGGTEEEKGTTPEE